MRQVHKAGEKTFVDYSGLTVSWLDPISSEIVVYIATPNISSSPSLDSNHGI